MKNIKDQHIESIFEQARKIIPQTLDRAHEWLVALEEDACMSPFNNSAGWINTLRGFMRGLWGAEAIELEDLDDLDKVLEKKGLI